MVHELKIPEPNELIPEDFALYPLKKNVSLYRPINACIYVMHVIGMQGGKGTRIPEIEMMHILHSLSYSLIGTETALQIVRVFEI